MKCPNRLAGAAFAVLSASSLFAQDAAAPPILAAEGGGEFIVEATAEKKAEPAGKEEKAKPQAGGEKGKEQRDATKKQPAAKGGEKRASDGRDQRFRQEQEAISKACRERENRMMALHEAAQKLRDAGQEEAAERINQRLHAMMETRDPREDDATVANKIELDSLRQQVQALSSQIRELKSSLDQNNRILDEIVRHAVPEPSPAVEEQLRHELAQPEPPVVRKAK